MNLDRILEVLKKELVIWLPQDVSSRNAVARFKPVSFSGTVSEHQFVVIRYTDVVGDHFDGNATHDETGAMLVLPANLCESLFYLAQHKCSLSAHLDEDFGDGIQPDRHLNAAENVGGL